MYGVAPPGRRVKAERMRAGRASDQHAYTLVAVLVLVALCSLGLAVAGPMWAQQTQREREQELLRIGGLYAQAIADYYERSPGHLKQHPERLEDLVRDPRFIGVTRHLRKLYPDPMEPHKPWAVIRDAGGRIVGVHSQSVVEPFLQMPIEIGRVRLGPATRYSDWKFQPMVKP